MAKNNKFALFGVIGDITFASGIKYILNLTNVVNISWAVVIMFAVSVGFFVCIYSFYYKCVAFVNSIEIKKLYIIKVLLHLFLFVGLVIVVNYNFDIFEKNNFTVGNLTNMSIVIISFGIIYTTIILLLPRRQYSSIGFVSTCLPLKIIGQNIETRLIYNPNHNKWMFPGGHVNVQSGEKPSVIAIKKAQTEAGLKVELIKNPLTLEKCPNREVLESPFFTYKMAINELVRCRKEKGHYKHIDYIYIGEYEEIGSGNETFEFVNVKIKIDTDDISINNIKTVLKENINTYDTEKEKKNPSNFDYDIPERLFNAIQKYKQYKEIYCERTGGIPICKQKSE